MKRVLLVVTFVVLAPVLGSAGEKGWFGFVVSVDGGGFWLNPTLRTVKVDKVVPSSPAAAAGLSAGDSVIAVEGITVAGAKAKTLQDAMKKSVGEKLRLKVRHGDAAPHDLLLTAAPKPES